jgi:hypothetical protein
MRRERAQEKIERAELMRQAQVQGLKAQLRVARENGDWDQVDDITEKMFDLRPQPQQAHQPPQPDAALKASYESFVSRNNWLSDRTLSRVFHRQLKVIADTNTADSPEDAFAQAADETRRMYPEKFGGNGSSPRTPIAETDAGHNASSGNGRGWNDLKPSVRKDFEMMIDSQIRPKNDTERKASMRRILAGCNDEHFRR